MRLNLNPSKLAVKLLGWSNLVLEIHNLHYKWWTSNFLTALLTHLPFRIPTFPHDQHSQGDFWHEVLSTYLRALSGSSSQLVQWEISSAHPCRVSLDRGWLVEHWNMLLAWKPIYTSLGDMVVLFSKMYSQEISNPCKPPPGAVCPMMWHSS